MIKPRRTPAPLTCAITLLAVGLILYLPVGTLTLRANKLLLLQSLILAATVCLIRNRLWRWLCWYTLAWAMVWPNGATLTTALWVFLAGAVIELIASHPHPSPIPDLLRCWRWLMGLQIGYMLLQVVGWDPLFVVLDPHSGRLVSGFLDNTATAGALAAMSLPLFGAGRWRWGLIPCWITLLATRSTGGVLVGAVLTLWMAWGWGTWRARAAVLAGVLALVLGYSLAVESLPQKVGIEHSEKFKVWRETLAMQVGVESSIPAPVRIARGVFGIGPGQFSHAYAGVMAQRHTTVPSNRPSMTGVKWSDPSNELIWLLCEFGLIGLLLVIPMGWGWLSSGWAAGGDMRLIVMMTTGWLMVALYHSPVHLSSLAAIGLVLVGTLEWSRRSHAS